MNVAAPILLALVLLLAPFEGAEAQISLGQEFGGQLSYGTGDRALGLGVRSETRVFPAPLALAVSADYFFPRCGIVGCSLWQAHANAKLDLGWLLPFDAFTGGGMHYRSFTLESPAGSSHEAGTGINVLGGIRSGRSFLEARYEITDEIPDQWVFGFGFMF